MHQVTQPAILYLGTPVVLISTSMRMGRRTSHRCRQSGGWEGRLFH